MNGITYGPFPPNPAGEPFPETARLESDLRMIATLGFNTLRLYSPPTPALRSAALVMAVEALVAAAAVGLLCAYVWHRAA